MQRVDENVVVGECHQLTACGTKAGVACPCQPATVLLHVADARVRPIAFLEVRSTVESAGRFSTTIVSTLSYCAGADALDAADDRVGGPRTS